MATLPDKGSGISHIMAGAGIGLLVGLLVGLSVSPVVGAVVGGLTALLAAFLGLTDQQLLASDRDFPDDEQVAREERRRIREWRTGSFGFACVIGVLVGLLIRTHNLMGVPLEEQYRDWLAMGFSEDRARELLVFEQLGLQPGLGLQLDVPQAQRARVSVLYSSGGDQCRSLAPDRFANASELLQAWDLQREGSWQNMARILRSHVPADGWEPLAQTMWNLACAD